MLKRCDLSLISDVNDWLPLAAADHFEYLVQSVEQHRPARRRLPSGKLRPKSDFDFLVRWEGLPDGEDNPSWEPWSNTSLRSCDAYLEYLQRSEVKDALGADFAGKPTEDREEPSANKRKRV